MELYSSDYCDIHFEETNSQMKEVWKKKTEKMTDFDFKKEQRKLAELFEHHKPKTMYTDAKEFLFTIVPDLQEWNAQEVLSHFAKNGGKKIGILLPKDIFTAISIEQALDEAKKEAFETQYFDNTHALENWLAS